MKRILFPVPNFMKITKCGLKKNQVGLSVDFDAKVFGRSVMRKWRSKNKKVDGKAVKHYFGFKIPKSVT